MTLEPELGNGTSMTQMKLLFRVLCRKQEKEREMQKMRGGRAGEMPYEQEEKGEHVMENGQRKGGEKTKERKKIGRKEEKGIEKEKMEAK